MTNHGGGMPSGELLPDGMRMLSRDEIAAFLRGFPGQRRAAPLPDAEGVAIDRRESKCGHALWYLLSLALSAFFGAVELFGKENLLWVALVVLLLLVVFAAYILVDGAVMVIQSGTVFFRGRGGLWSSRRLLRPGDILRIRHGRHRPAEDPDSVERHSVEFVLADGERLSLLGADAGAGKADWLLDFLRRRLDVPFEEDNREQEQAADISGGVKTGGAAAGEDGGAGKAFLPLGEKPDFSEFSVLLPGMRAYERILRHLRLPSAPPADRQLEGFVLREEKLTGVICFFLALVIFLGVWSLFAALSGTAVLLLAVAALAVGALASILTERKCFFFTADALLSCGKNGAVLWEIPRESIEAVRTRRILPGCFSERVAEWKTAAVVRGGEIPLMTFRNPDAAKWFVDAVRMWSGAAGT